MKRIILGILIIALAVVIVLFVMGFWRADIRQGELPKIDVETESGKLPQIELQSKEVVVRDANESIDEVEVEIGGNKAAEQQ